MSDWSVEGSVPGPLLALAVVAVLMVLLRWAFGRGRSLVARQPRRGGSDQYGLLVKVAGPATYADADRLRQRLEAAGLRVTVAPALDGPAVMVFPEDVDRARAVLDRPADPPPPAS